MKPNQLRALLAGGHTAYGTMIQEVRNPSISQIMAHAGCDFLFFDAEHGPFTFETVADMVRVARLSGITPLVRVPDAQYHLIARFLDLGAQGIMIPRVETRAQVEYIVQSALYPPLGQRGCSVNKGHNDFQSENEWLFTESANRENLIILQIERAQAVKEIDDLLSVPGVGAALIGPNDMALSLGVRAADQLAALEAPIQRVLDACQARGLPCGIHVANLEWLARWQQRGMQLICYSSDLNFLSNGAATGIRWLRDQAGTAPRS
ncbi:MAG TPA: aldolase/citrate lyase family protein [Anaerolineae bacterium]|nr:aldolase/citrate lyase family protein [Anaerolineae bacterium]